MRRHSYGDVSNLRFDRSQSTLCEVRDGNAMSIGGQDGDLRWATWKSLISSGANLKQVSLASLGLVNEILGKGVRSAQAGSDELAASTKTVP